MIFYSEDAADTFDAAREQLQRALDRGDGSHSMEDIRAAVLQGRMQLWYGDDYAAVTEVLNYPQKRAVLVRLAAGKLDALLAHHGELDKFAKLVGAEDIELFGRRGWVKALKGYGWEEEAVHMTKRVQ